MGALAAFAGVAYGRRDSTIAFATVQDVSNGAVTVSREQAGALEVVPAPQAKRHFRVGDRVVLNLDTSGGVESVEPYLDVVEGVLTGRAETSLSVNGVTFPAEPGTPVRVLRGQRDSAKLGSLASIQFAAGTAVALLVRRNRSEGSRVGAVFVSG